MDLLFLLTLFLIWIGASWGQHHELVHLMELPSHLKPTNHRGHHGRRLIFIGDVHGAYDELVELLAKVRYRSSTGNSSLLK
jgi:hypothetical protein